MGRDPSGPNQPMRNSCRLSALALRHRRDFRPRNARRSCFQREYVARRHRQVNELGVGKRLNADPVDFPWPSVYRRHRFPPEVISYAVWLCFRFPLSLRMVEEMLAGRGICATYETVRQWGKKFGKAFSDQIRQRAPARGDKWHKWHMG